MLAGTRLAPAFRATAATAAPAPAPAPRTQWGGEHARNRIDRAITVATLGTMNPRPPTSAPGVPARRYAQKIASWVDAGPGSRLQAAIASSNSVAQSQPRRVTTRSLISAMWAGGPPK